MNIIEVQKDIINSKSYITECPFYRDIQLYNFVFIDNCINYETYESNDIVTNIITDYYIFKINNDYKKLTTYKYYLIRSKDNSWAFIKMANLIKPSPFNNQNEVFDLTGSIIKSYNLKDNYKSSEWKNSLFIDIAPTFNLSTNNDDSNLLYTRENRGFTPVDVDYSNNQPNNNNTNYSDNNSGENIMNLSQGTFEVSFNGNVIGELTTPASLNSRPMF